MNKDIFDNPLSPGDLVIHSTGFGMLAYSVIREVCGDKIKVAYPKKITTDVYRIVKSILRSGQIVKVPIEAMQNWELIQVANEYRKLQEIFKPIHTNT